MTIRFRRLAIAAAAAVALVGVTGCRIHPSSPGFDLPTGGGLWIIDVDTPDRGTVRGVWSFCLGTEETPRPCGTSPQHNWTEIGVVGG